MTESGNTVTPTCPELLDYQLDLMMYELWMFFWVFMAVYIMLNLVLPVAKHFMMSMKMYMQQNSQDHVEIAHMINNKNNKEKE